MKTTPVRIREDQYDELEELAAILPIRSSVSALVERAVDWLIQNEGPVYREHFEKLRTELSQVQRQPVVMEMNRS
jgi:hypothetical protein